MAREIGVPANPYRDPTGSLEGSRDTEEGIVVSTEPDICLTPCGSSMVPVGYNIWAKQADDARTTPTVKLTNLRSHNMGSLIISCHGDEAGTGGGVKSGTHNGICEPKGHSTNVYSEGKQMIRHSDEWWMNNRNTVGKLNYVKDVGAYGRWFEAQAQGSAKSDPSSSNQAQKVMSDATPDPLRPGQQYAQALPAEVEPPPPPPPPAQVQPPGGNVIPFPGVGPQNAPPSGPIVGPAISPLPPGDPGFFRNYAPEPNALGGYDYNTDLPAPLTKVGWFPNIFRKDSDGYFLYDAPGGGRYASADEVNRLYAQIRRRQAAQRREDAAMVDRSVVRVTGEPGKMKCWSLDKQLAKQRPKGANPNADYPGDADYIREFCNQLKEQERAINQLTPEQYQQGRGAFKSEGRGDGVEQARFREQIKRQWTKNMIESGMSPMEAASAVADILGPLAALHTPDQIVGGSNSIVNRMGMSSVNSSIGGGWPTRIDDLDSYAQEAKRIGKPKMNVKLCATVNGVEVCN